MTKMLSVPPVHLPEHLAETIIVHAREGAPEEICGVLRGRGLHAYEVVRGQNIADERIENYTVDPQTLLRQFDFEDAGDEMMGIYHSHPVSEAYPSATDAWNAYYPDAVYFICSLEFPSYPVIRAFRLVTQTMGSGAESVVRSLPFDEVRPGLFAYYQPGDVAVPLSLSSIVQDSVVQDIAPPFYIVYYVSPDSDAGSDLTPEIRAVSVVEHPVIQE